MTVYSSFILFAFIIVIYLIIAEIFTILFRFTGLDREKASFQVISLLTGCGFTTGESELVTSSRQRRRLAKITMMFGYVFNITIVSSIINVFLSLKQSQLKDFMLGFLIPIVIFAVILVLFRIPAVKSWSQRVLEKLAGKVLGVDAENYALVMDYIDDNTITQVRINKVPRSFVGKSLAETALMTDYNILVLLIERPGRKAVPANARTVFTNGDKLTVFGRYDVICKAFEAKEAFSDIDK